MSDDKLGPEGVCGCCKRPLTGRDAKDRACLYCVLNGHFDVDEPGDVWAPTCSAVLSVDDVRMKP